MSLRSKLYWLDRAFKGDRKPVMFIVAWALVVLGLFAAGKFLKVL